MLGYNIWKTYHISHISTLANLEWSIQSIQEESTPSKLRTIYTIRLKSDERVITIPCVLESNALFTSTAALISFRQDIQSLYGMRNKKQYEAWKARLLQIGRYEEVQDRKEFARKVEVYRKVKYVLGEWFQIFLHCQLDA